VAEKSGNITEHHKPVHRANCATQRLMTTTE